MSISLPGAELNGLWPPRSREHKPAFFGGIFQRLLQRVSQEIYVLCSKYNALTDKSTHWGTRGVTPSGHAEKQVQSCLARSLHCCLAVKF